MNILIFDTETTSLDKPFAYNIGYVIYNLDENRVILERDFVIEQIWHNIELFASAYYADKRPLYVSRMKGKKAKMTKFGFCMTTLRNDIKHNNVEYGFAYNSSFDERVFDFNCDHYKVSNPLDTIPIYDIRGYAMKFVCGDDYKDFCEKNELFTESGNYSTTAEALFRYLSQNIDFVEEHTALSDSRIETEILKRAIECGADITIPETAPKSLERLREQTLTIKKDKEIVGKFSFRKMIFYKSKNTISLKG